MSTSVFALHYVRKAAEMIPQIFARQWLLNEASRIEIIAGSHSDWLRNDAIGRDYFLNHFPVVKTDGRTFRNRQSVGV
jgi:hypothetical protein